MKAETLLAAAAAARLKAYAPYSQFLVGAALLTSEGVLVTGGNTENASYGLTVCAERVAVWSAVQGGHRRFEKIAVVTDTTPPSSPCGACRQVLWELAGNLEVIMGNLRGEMISKSLAELLALPFGSARWNDNPVNERMLEGEEIWRLPLSFQPVGYVLSPYKTREEIPDNYRELLSQVIIDPEMQDGLYRLDEEKVINVISYLHRARGYTLKEKRSGRGNEVYGIFACRAPLRPNALAQTTVDLVAVDNNILTVRGLDLLDGTPVLDIKTVLPNR